MEWDAAVTERNAVLAQLAGLINTDKADWPTISELNQTLGARLPIRFIDDNDFAALNCYYEQAVAQGMVPTRAANWHDFFGAVIWALYPNTKVLLNRLHMVDIEAQGLRKRTPKRDRITHFDECGMVLAVTDKAEIERWLRDHDWQQLFIEQRHRWGDNWQPFVFGHALYEQALTPFIGMTAKCVIIEMTPDFFTRPLAEQYALLDTQLADVLEQSALFEQPRPLRPLPMLGIPGWWPANEDVDFYNNRDYFRPRRNR
ncbi:hypothetical protein GCM10011502_20140 [Oceanisphaera marina]|uniref:DUF3025 domain-containing protein n=1 Tax=Oceanisphaera marina TaxID=2017550 RepID=A0ABQ1IQV6_9GAMM|nr:DUF3025 domain-containing protein [Oceanisphaera marina]GGB46702.1 hypothetical protein GCM10011502_20140 [Oceanisphaera marina]